MESGTDAFTSNYWSIANLLKRAVDHIIGTLLCYDCIKLNGTIFLGHPVERQLNNKLTRQLLL